MIVPATEPVITCQCLRVPVLNGHTAAVFVKFRKKPTKEQLIEALRNFKGLPQELELPSAPKQFIQYLEEDNRPQVSEDDQLRTTEWAYLLDVSVKTLFMIISL